MKIIINNQGNLELERHGHMKLQQCPYKSQSISEYCSDCCPLFEEPVYRDGYDQYSYINICNNKTLCGEIVDERT